MLFVHAYQRLIQQRFQQHQVFPFQWDAALHGVGHSFFLQRLALPRERQEQLSFIRFRPGACDISLFLQPFKKRGQRSGVEIHLFP